MTQSLTNLDRELSDLSAWNPETHQWTRQYIANHCTRYHLLILAELAGCRMLLATLWPTREELLDALDTVGPQQLLEAWHRFRSSEWERVDPLLHCHSTTGGTTSHPISAQLNINLWLARKRLLADRYQQLPSPSAWKGLGTGCE